ncbi:hypothetical protein QUF72_14655 [Desulfobacterales bacterium HSG2]|nr:hypothetical protein [Desulfobacterales bacterium HSG2]
MAKRNVGIVGDGATDRLVFLKLATIILSGGINQVELRRQNIRDAIDRYWKDASTKNEYFFPSKPAITLRNSIIRVLTGAFADFQGEIGAFSNQDILLLNTDSERHLQMPDDYFKEWAFCVQKIITAGIEMFYHLKAREGYPCEYLPLILSISAFPSTEILIAAAKGINTIYGKKAGELKQVLYGTTDLSTLRDEEFEEKALKYITPENINSIFKKIPESRILIQSLSIGKMG